MPWEDRHHLPHTRGVGATQPEKAGPISSNPGREEGLSNVGDAGAMGDMGDTGGGDMGPMEHMGDHAMSLLPGWLGIVLGVASIVVIVPHLRHVTVTAGQHRWWHAGHIIMALGMAQMYLLGMGTPAVDNALSGLFGASTLVVLVVAARCRTREGVVNPLWIATALDMAAMAYMYAPQSLRPAPLTWLVIVYLVMQAAAWATGAWGRMPVFATVPATVPAGGADGGAATSAGGDPMLVPRPGLGLSGRKDPGVRATLTAMALLMAYMLVAMV